ncbi:hypothetical protein ACQJBY_021633 [Aegilops geniculata]
MDPRPPTRSSSPPSSDPLEAIPQVVGPPCKLRRRHSPSRCRLHDLHPTRFPCTRGPCSSPATPCLCFMRAVAALETRAPCVKLALVFKLAAAKSRCAAPLLRASRGTPSLQCLPAVQIQREELARSSRALTAPSPWPSSSDRVGLPSCSPASPPIGPWPMLWFRSGVVTIRSTTWLHLLHGLVLLPSGILGKMTVTLDLTTISAMLVPSFYRYAALPTPCLSSLPNCHEPLTFVTLPSKPLFVYVTAFAQPLL